MVLPGMLMYCERCHNRKAIREFPSGIAKVCLVCQKEKSVKTKKKEKKRRPLTDEQRKRKNARRRERSLPEFYTAMFLRQGGVCAICREKPKLFRRLVVDHDHRTGRVRGLLCDNCNRAIGLLKDKSQILHKAIKYLDEEL